MFTRKVVFTLISLRLFLPCSAQEQVEDGCYSGASIFGAVTATLAVVLILLAVGYLLWRIYWRTRRGKHLVLVTDNEKGADYAFDNPVFREGTPIGRTNEKEDHKVRWPCWTPLSALNKSNKPKALDDSYLGQPMVNVVPLRSHDFTGLGFNICGNMRDGIFVKDVLHRGPASESGRIVPGDRIESIRISFRHMVFEDALTILSYASPYEVQLEVENGSSSRPSTLLRNKRSSVSPAERICHPFYRSQSISDISQIKKSGSYRMSPEQPASIPEVSNGDLSKPAIIETSPIDKLQKFGVRVLPPSEPVRATEPEKHQNVRNSMIESTHVQSSSSPKTEHKSNTLRSYMEEIDLSDVGQNFNNSNFYDETDAGSRKETPSPATKESNVKSILVKGIQNLKERLQPIVNKLEKDPDDITSLKTSPSSIKESEEEIIIQNNKKETDETVLQKEDIFSKQYDNISFKNGSVTSSDVTDIPLEVQRAGMAAKSNRKSLVEIERKRKDSSGGESSNEGDSQHLPKKGKRKAPQPPQMTTKQDNAEDENIHDTISEKNHSLDSADTDSEAGDKSGTTIELNASHITVHHAPDTESNRKAASLGDLSRIDDEQPMVVLERAVSLDLADGTPGGSKKRKAPLPPQGEEFSDEGGSPFCKGARLDNGIKARLKKSSDWGTLEDAVHWKCTTLSDDEETDAGVSGFSTPEKSPESHDIVSSTPYHDLPSPSDSERISNMHVSSCSWDMNLSNSSGEQFLTAVNGTSKEHNSDEDDIPPDLPTSPMPTYITEIQVVTTPDKVAVNTPLEYGDSSILNPPKNLLSNYRTADNLTDNSLFESQSSNTVEIITENEGENHAVPHFILSGTTKHDINTINSTESEILPTFPSDKIFNSGDICQVSISQPNSLDIVIHQETSNSGKESNIHITPTFSNENMSDEQILALKSSSPEPVTLDNGPNGKLQIVRPDRQRNNISVTSIKAGGSRIPVRTPPEPAQRKVKWTEPGNYISYSSLNVSGNSEKQLFVDRNGTEHNVTQIFLDNPK
ncbi:uncharacterized protein LOC142319032 [Lycorma delicatula]|uniref:uncharacterized protein LOC142319032 n=1 Tax=Lycorma delicatula TaxID=130591 RepID=UPI003F5130B0